jgi:hypothetical protein
MMIPSARLPREVIDLVPAIIGHLEPDANVRAQ